MDDLGDGAVPRCPNDSIVMRDIPGGWECPDCGHTLLPTAPIGVPPRFNGPTIRGG